MADAEATCSVSKTPKRARNPDDWARNKKKLQRNSGKEYVTATSAGEERKVEAKRVGKDCACPLKCFARVSEERRSEILDGFWELGDWSSQNSYICGCIKIAGVQRRYGKQDRAAAATPPRRNFTRLYFVNNEDCVPVRICKKAFLALHALSNGRVTRTLQKFQEKGSPQLDQRGKHEPANKTPEESLRYIRAHIKSFPAETSHYCRKDNPNRKCLSPDLNIKKMFELYLEKCKDDGQSPVKENVYRSVFNTKFNLSFGTPKTYTCNTCDKLNVSIAAETDVQKRRRLEV